MKKYELKQIIREVIEEARSHGGKASKSGKIQGFRKNTIYGGEDRLKRRADVVEPYGKKDKERFMKASIKIDRNYPDSEDKKYYIDSRGREKLLKPKSTFKKSGVGKIKESFLQEKAPKRKAFTAGPNMGERPNTVRGGKDQLKRRETISKAMAKGPDNKKFKQDKTKSMIKDRNSKTHSWTTDWHNSDISFEPKSSYKKSGVGRNKPKPSKNPNTARGAVSDALKSQGQLGKKNK